MKNVTLLMRSRFESRSWTFLNRNQYKMFYINRYFCDIVPECFFGLFRQDHAQREKNFFDAYHPDKDIDHVYYDRDGRLTVVYDDGDSRQSIYCHLQKRAMSMDFDRYEDGYYICEDAFRLVLGSKPDCSIEPALAGNAKLYCLRTSGV